MSQLAESRCSLNFAKARRALQDADKGVCPIGTYYPADLADVGLGHPACFAVFRWLAASFEGNSSTSCETSLLSASKLPIGDIESDILELAVSHGQAISCQLSAKHTCKGAGGRRVSQEQDECFTPGAGSFRVELKVQWDIYTWEGVQSSQYNHFRVDKCSNLAGFQQWCKGAVCAAAALRADHPSWTDQAALSQSAHDPASNSNAYSTQAPRLSAEHLLSLPSGSKRSRVTLDTSPSNGSSDSSDSTQSVAQLAHAVKGLRLQVSNVETTVSQQAVRIDQVYEQVQEHNDDLVEIHFQNAQPSSARPSNAAHNSALYANNSASYANNSPSYANNSASYANDCSSKLYDLAIGDLENPIEDSNLIWDEELGFRSNLSLLCDPDLLPDLPSMSSYNVSTPPVPIPPAANTESHSGAAQPAKTACPAFDANLTKEQMQPFVLQALLSIKPRSCSALDLSKDLWPEETAMRSCMKRVVSGVLYSKAVSAMVIQNGTHWSHK
ncbi:hypothetical protein ABBQ38_007755 [Trebouxia sp. C0009 RCD-2024]